MEIRKDYKLKIKPDITISQLLVRFPDGFVISNTGHAYNIIGNPCTDPGDLPMIINRKGGYLSVGVPEKKQGDEFYLVLPSDSEGD